MMQDRVAYADSLKALIYEDYLRSMELGARGNPS